MDNMSSSVLDLLQPSDIAYTILCVDMSRNVWSKTLMVQCPPLVVDASAGAGDGNEETEASPSLIYFKMAAHIKTFGDGWTDLGRGRLAELMNIFRKAMDGVFWEELRGHWEQYSTTNKLPFYAQVLDSTAPPLPSSATGENQQGPRGIIYLPGDDDNDEEDEYQHHSKNGGCNYLDEVTGGGYESSSSSSSSTTNGVEPIQR